MKVKILKHCIDGVTHQSLYEGDIIDFTEERLARVPIGYVEVISEPKKKGRPPKKKEVEE